ncbi:hypothetical protein KI387_030663, partial [Taxus chinensis]
SLTNLATYQFHHSEVVYVPDRFETLLCTLVHGCYHSEASHQPWFHMPTPCLCLNHLLSHTVGNPTDTSEIPKIPVGDKEFAKILDANPSV